MFIVSLSASKEGGRVMQVSDKKEIKVKKETLVELFLTRLYENGDINPSTYFNAMEELKEEEYVD